MSNISDEDLERLFPRLTSCSSDSSEALAQLLRRNFNLRQPINDHISQQLFAIWALGGTHSLLQAANDRPAPGPPNTGPEGTTVDININNWTEYPRNAAYFVSFRRFFAKQVLDPTNTFESLLDTFPFSPLVQTTPVVPTTFSAAITGGLHIFDSSNTVGLATEFGSPGMLVDGLTLAVVSPSMPGNTKSTALLLSQRLDLSLGNNAVFDGENRTAASTTSRVDEGYLSENEEIKAKTVQPTAPTTTAMNADNVKKRIRMLGFLTTIIYGVGGLQGDLPFRADFNLMNLTAASFFNYSLLKHLSTQNQELLLSTFLSATLQMWDKAGRPLIDMNNFYNHTTANPQPPGCIPVPHPSALDPENTTPNSFYRILQSAMMHPNAHLSKFQRALSLFSAWYGTTPPGSFTADDFPSGDNAPVIAGIDRLDGTLFVRVAGLTADRLGWVREGEAPRGWDGE